MAVTERSAQWTREAIRERITSDFRDFRFTWGGFFRWSGITLIAVLIAAIVTLYFLDWNQMRGPIGRYLSHRTGREVRLDGNLSVKLFSWQPGLDARDVTIGNPSWLAGRAQMPYAATVKEFRIELRLLPLLSGRLVLPLVRIDQPDIYLLREESGRTNWDRGGKNPNEAFRLPPIRRFLVRDGHVRIDDDVRKLHFTGTVSSEENQGGKGAAFTLKGDGSLNQNKFLADVSGGPLLNVDESKPYKFAADVRAGETHAVIDGAITQPFHLDRFTAGINVSGPTLSELYSMTGLVLPNTPPYRMTLNVVRESSTKYRLNDIKAIMGGTDLQGDLAVDAAQDIPLLTGQVTSRVLNFADLGAVVGGGKHAPAESRYMLPETVLHTERLRQSNAEVDYRADSIKSRDFPLTGLNTHISVQDGVLNLKPLAFGFTQGKLSGSLKVDGRKAVPTSSVDARITDLRAENFIKSSDKPIQGVLEARMVLSGAGSSVHAAAANANGTFTAVVPTGGMRHSLAEWTGVDVLSALSLNLANDNSNTNLRCAVASFQAKDGVLTAQQFLIDTDPVRVEGSGTINMRDESLDLELQGKPKNFQLVRLRAPITVKGSLAHPALGLKAEPLVGQGGIAAALAFINPLASILAFIDPGLAKDANCGPLLTAAKAQGAPVKPSAAANAPVPRK
ncbi:MAG TPA: AsmA family protein [Rhizomicrobium sp.]|nr:AsmA family protein [Rhizomicrobium sp.]